MWDELELHQRRAAVVVGGRQTPYPIQIHTAALAPEVRRDCLLGFIRAWARQEREGAEPPDFATWVQERFGEGLARHFFVPYNEKLYRAPAEELSLDWVGRYVPRPTLEEVVDGALGLHDRPVGYNATFRYPRRGGIRLLPDAVARRVPGLELGSRAVALHLGERWVETADGRRLAFDRLVSTVALPGLVDLLVGGLPDEVAAARTALRWVRVLGVALGVEGEAPSPEHWLYFPDRGLPFYRVGFPSNHGRLAPEGCHTVSIELSLDPGGAQVAEEAAAAEAALAAIGLLDRRTSAGPRADRHRSGLRGVRPPAPAGTGRAAPLLRRPRRAARRPLGGVEVLGDGGRHPRRHGGREEARRWMTHAAGGRALTPIP